MSSEKHKCTFNIASYHLYSVIADKEQKSMFAADSEEAEHKYMPQKQQKIEKLIHESEDQPFELEKQNIR